jgi:hypothetical protein
VNRAQRAVLIVGGIVVLVALLVAAVAPVSAGEHRCGSALLARDEDEYLTPDDEYTLAPDDDYPPLEVRELLQVIAEECDTARWSRLGPAVVGALAGGAVMAAGGALLRTRKEPPREAPDA